MCCSYLLPTVKGEAPGVLGRQLIFLIAFLMLQERSASIGYDIKAALINRGLLPLICRDRHVIIISWLVSKLAGFVRKVIGICKCGSHKNFKPPIDIKGKVQNVKCIGSPVLS